MNWRRAAGILFGGVLLAGLMIGGLFFYASPTASKDIDYLNCVESAEVYCASGADSFNVSNSRDCQLGPNSAEKVREIDSVEAVNKSTGIVTCKTD